MAVSDKQKHSLMLASPDKRTSAKNSAARQVKLPLKKINSVNKNPRSAGIGAIITGAGGVGFIVAGAVLGTVTAGAAIAGAATGMFAIGSLLLAGSAILTGVMCYRSRNIHKFETQPLLESEDLDSDEEETEIALSQNDNQDVEKSNEIDSCKKNDDDKEKSKTLASKPTTQESQDNKDKVKDIKNDAVANAVALMKFARPSANSYENKGFSDSDDQENNSALTQAHNNSIATPSFSMELIPTVPPVCTDLSLLTHKKPNYHSPQPSYQDGKSNPVALISSNQAASLLSNPKHIICTEPQKCSYVVKTEVESSDPHMTPEKLAAQLNKKEQRILTPLPGGGHQIETKELLKVTKKD